MKCLLPLADFNAYGLVADVGAWGWITYLALGVVALFVVPYLLGVRYIPNNRVGIVEKLWSGSGSVTDGRLIALDGEAGYQAETLRGGLHFFLWPWQYRVHKTALTIVPQGKIGYVFARDGEPLPPTQTLGRIVPCNHFQDARAFLTGSGQGGGARDAEASGGDVGQRGRQRDILREGVYAINLALFVVIGEDHVYRLILDAKQEIPTLNKWHQELLSFHGFDPVVVGAKHVGVPVATAVAPGDIEFAESQAWDTIAVVTLHDGPALEPGEIIAPPVGTHPEDANYHNNYQDIEAFLRAGGRRGRQYVPLTDGTYFINRWFASVEQIPKTVVPIGNVGVVVSYCGKAGVDVSGETFRHGERVAEGSRGVQAKTLGPGKYPFNTYAGHVQLVPTTNFVLHWITGRSESHKYDESLKSIEMVTADAYEPLLPLSVVVHIDYQKAPNVVQRFGDVKKLITQTLDPMLSAFFRDIAHTKTMLSLLRDRADIQREARDELRSRFAVFDIELVDVLIGKPVTVESTGQIETLLEQLRTRQLSREQMETYQQQCLAVEHLKTLKLAQAQAEKQTELTNSQVEIQIAANRAEGELVRARKQAEQTVVTAEAENKRRLLIAEAESKAAALAGEGESRRVALEGQAQARVLEQKIASYGDSRLYALSVVAQYLAESRQPLVPERLFMSAGGASGSGETGASSVAQGPLATLVNLLVAEKSGFQPDGASAASKATPTDAVPSTSKASPGEKN